MSDVPGNGAPTSGPRWPYLALAMVLILGAVLVAVVYVLLPDEDDPDYPAAWDPRVQPYVDVVEDERGLEFKHPIHVDFLSVKDFRKKVTTDDADLTDKDREEIRQYAGLLRAAGLIEGGFDLLETMNRFQGAGVLGYYNGEDERIRIRGTKLTPAVESTLVHELTQAGPALRHH